MTTSNAFVSPDFSSFKDSSVNTDMIISIHNPGHEPSVRIRDIESERPQQGSRQRKNEFEPYLNGDITNISQFTAAQIEQPTSVKTQNTESVNSEDISNLLKAEPYNYEELHIPEWFDSSTIHDVEKLAVLEFFENGTMTPNDYIIFRNTIIESYRANADYYLTVSSCKSKLPNIDLFILVRIHNFLESNKLINTIADPRRRIFDPYIESSPEAQLLPHSQRDFKDINKADLQYLKNLVYDVSETKKTRESWDLSVEDPLNADSRKKYECSTCHTDCSEIRYQSLKFKNVQACIDCFLEGKFSAALSSGDFLRVDESGADLNMEEEWTDMEILKLLEGVEKYDDDWLLISEHVGSRTKEQCITQFLQLPINDEFLSTRPTQMELEEIPFGTTPNPVMAIIAFLSGHINSGVASAAAKSALQILMKLGEDSNATSTKVKEEVDMNCIKEEDVNMDKKECEQSEEVAEAFSKDTMKKATISALEAAVETARKLASYENEEIQHWARLAVKTTVEKLSLKLQQYDALETSLENEHEEMEKQANVLASSIETLVSQYQPLMESDKPVSSSAFNMS
ncbi:hypothetical protein G6F37_003760 [Rhizopus arrhizus]|nr:hypothetical protein G6F38_003909 [Rhizopus arrhizus]KAG1160697.1 hypothetical protein G6F37_003760 [Rhizopus arrhizus]